MNVKTEYLKNVKIGSITVNTNYLSNKTNYAVCSSRDVKYIVVHYTGNAKDTALNNAKYFQGSNRGASAHFFVDDNNIFQCVALKDRAWHCGSKTNSKYDCVNQNAIGIEMCCSGNYKVSDKTKNNTIELVAYLCKMLGISANDIDKYVLRHYDCGTEKKSCPRQFVANPSEWTSFKAKLKSKLQVNKVNLQQWGAAFADIEHIGYIPMNGAKGETVTAAAARKTWNGRVPDAICNGEFYNMTTYTPASGIVSKENGQENWTDQWGIAFVDGKKPVLTYKNNVNANDWIAGYPLLVKDGQVAIPDGFNALPGKRGRTALAFNDYKFSMIWVKENEGCTIEDFAYAIKEAGFTNAINLDGGGSTAGATTMWSYDQGRSTRGKIGMWIKNGTGNKLQKKITTSTTQSKPATTTTYPTGMQKDESKRNGVPVKIVANGGLNLRKSAPNGTVLEILDNGTSVKWYGYYCYANNEKYFYVLAPSGKEGYIAAKYTNTI